MLVVLIGPDLEENLSLRYLSSSLKAAGHTVHIAAFDKRADADRVGKAARGADLIGLSMCYQIRAREFLDLAAALRKDNPSARVVVGGHYASCEARHLLEHHPCIDVVAVHEGERTIVDLAALSTFDEASLAMVQGIVFRGAGGLVATPPRPMQADLDQLPWADRTGPARLVVGVPTAYMMGSRGCLGACDYCCITTLHRLVPGKRFRQRSTDDIADEMASLYHDRGVRQFVFHDDNFLVTSVEHNLERIDALDGALRQRGVRRIGLVLKCRPADVDRQVFLRLREMGLLRVFLGIESATEEGLRSIGRRQTVEQSHRALRICEELGISTQYTIIIFHPEATPQTIRADLRFVREHLAHPLSFCRAEAYAGTPLEQRMISTGRAHGDYLFRNYTFTDPATEQLWSCTRRALRERMWSCDHLLGRVVQLDHLAAVFRHFYEGREVDALVAEFLDWQLAVNQDSVALFSELIDACETLAPGSPELDRFLVDLQNREQASHVAFEARRSTIREALYERSFAMIGLSRPRKGPPRMTAGARGARHAAAVFAAIGLIGCGGTTEEGTSTLPDAASDKYQEPDGVYEAPPWDGNYPQPDAADGSPDASTDTGNPDAAGDASDAASEEEDAYVEDSGVYEAPPWDGP
jgi:anaerobic magnesium-protoporphyrin IX monomethyl ester cyclase